MNEEALTMPLPGASAGDNAGEVSGDSASEIGGDSVEVNAPEVPVKRVPTVYFIDDSATMREVIKIAFRRENINVITCSDAAAALAQFEQNRPDVVITDVIMPDQDGYSVCSQIKQNPALDGIPVVLMSGVVNKSVADKAVAVKADELIRKPFQPQELIGRVKTLLAPKNVPAIAPRERGSSGALQSLFAPPAPVAATPQILPAPPAAVVHQAPMETAWPRALAEAFTPLLQPFSSNAAQQSANHEAQTRSPLSPLPSQLAGSQNNHQTPASSAEVAKLRAEIARVELLVRKLQSELQLEREYNVALEQQIRTLMASS